MKRSHQEVLTEAAVGLLFNHTNFLCSWSFNLSAKIAEIWNICKCLILRQLWKRSASGWLCDRLLSVVYNPQKKLHFSINGRQNRYRVTENNFINSRLIESSQRETSCVFSVETHQSFSKLWVVICGTRFSSQSEVVRAFSLWIFHSTLGDFFSRLLAAEVFRLAVL